jgi:hypothetical protein
MLCSGQWTGSSAFGASGVIEYEKGDGGKISAAMESSPAVE